MEDTGGKGSICLAFDESISEVCHVACSATGYHGDWQQIMQCGKCFQCETLFHSIVVHAGEEYLACATVGNFFSPFEQSTVGGKSPSIDVACPLPVFVFGVDGANAHLGTEVTCDVVDE